MSGEKDKKVPASIPSDVKWIMCAVCDTSVLIQPWSLWGVKSFYHAEHQIRMYEEKEVPASPLCYCDEDEECKTCTPTIGYVDLTPHKYSNFCETHQKICVPGNENKIDMIFDLGQKVPGELENYAEKVGLNLESNAPAKQKLFDRLIEAVEIKSKQISYAEVLIEYIELSDQNSFREQMLIHLEKIVNILYTI